MLSLFLYRHIAKNQLMIIFIVMIRSGSQEGDFQVLRIFGSQKSERNSLKLKKAGF